jgi:hypothetical protein
MVLFPGEQERERGGLAVLCLAQRRQVLAGKLVGLRGQGARRP